MSIVQPAQSQAGSVADRIGNAHQANDASADLQSQIRRILESCPIAGEGVNDWLFTAALKLHRMNIESETIEQLLEEATWNCGRAMKPDEIERAVRNSHPDKLKGRPWRRKWPQRNYEQIEAIAIDGVRLSQLEQQSPVQLDPCENHAEKVIDALFPGDPWLCAGPSLDFVLTRPRKEWAGFFSRQQFIVPSAMTKRKGQTQDGTLSARSLENVAATRCARGDDFGLVCCHPRRVSQHAPAGPCCSQPREKSSRLVSM
jgi:hypothetical protein